MAVRVFCPLPLTTSCSNVLPGAGLGLRAGLKVGQIAARHSVMAAVKGALPAVAGIRGVARSVAVGRAEAVLRGHIFYRTPAAFMNFAISANFSKNFQLQGASIGAP